MKRILFYHDEFPCGGAERVTMDIADYLSGIGGYEVFVMVCNKKRDVPGLQMLELPDGHRDSLASADFFVQTINTLSIDVFVLPVHILEHLDYILSCTHCKLVFAPHSIPLWEAVAKIASKKKYVQHRFLKKLEWYLLIYPKAKWLGKYEKRFIEEHRRVYLQADAYVTLCEDYKSQLIRLLGVSPQDSKFCVIPNSERIVEAVNRKKKKQLLFVGRLFYVDKRVDRLIKIWEMIYEQLPEWELIIVGDGEEKEALQAMAIQKKLQRIHFAGYQEEVKKYYEEASVLCLTSTYEGWGLCLTEAQANGVVPIAFDCSAGVHEILSPSGENGILISPFNLQKYAEALLALLEDPKKLAEMRENVIRKVKDYSPQRVGQKWVQLIESLAD